MGTCRYQPTPDLQRLANALTVQLKILRDQVIAESGDDGFNYILKSLARTINDLACETGLEEREALLRAMLAEVSAALK